MAEQDDLIASYIDRASIASDTAFFKSELLDVLEQFNTLSNLKLKLNIDSSWKDVAQTTTQVKQSTDALVSSMVTFRNTQNDVIETQKVMQQAYTIQNGSIKENAAALSLLKLALKDTVDQQKLYDQGLKNGEVSLEEYLDKTSEAILKQNELKDSISELNKVVVAQGRPPVPVAPAKPVDDPTNANIPFTVNQAPEDKPVITEGFTETAEQANAATAAGAASQARYAEALTETSVAEERFISATEKTAQVLVSRKLELKEVMDQQSALNASYKDGIMSEENYTAAMAPLIVEASELKIQIAALNAEINTASKADLAPNTSIDDLRARNAQLTAERNAIPVAPEAQSDGDKERLIEINALLDQNNALLKENADAYLKQKINIGNYPEQFKIAFAGVEGELTRVNGLLAQQGSSGDTTKLTQQQTALQNAVALVGQEFTSTTARQNAFKEAGKEIGSVYGTDSDVFKSFATNVAAGTAENKKLGDALTDNATKGSKFSSVLGSIFGSLRQIAYAIPGIGLAGLIGLLLDPLIALGSQFVKTKDAALAANGELENTADTLKKIDDVIAGTQSQFVKAVEDLDNVGEHFKLAEENIISQDDAVKLYNDTLGKTLGAVDNLSEAEARVAEKGKAYIQFTLLKAAAQIAQQKAAEQAFNAAQNQEKALSEFSKPVADTRVTQGGTFGFGTGAFDPAAYDAETQRINQARKVRQDQATKDFQDQEAVFDKIGANLRDKAAAIAKQFGLIYDPKTGQEQAAEQERDIQLQIDALTRYQAKQQAVASDDKNTYDRRLAALKNYNNAAQQIINLNEQKQLIPEYGDTIAQSQTRSSAQTQRTAATISGNKAVEDLMNAYYQRRIKAEQDAREALLTEDAKTQQSLYQDTSNGIDQRLNAYKQYVADQKALADSQFTTKLQSVGFTPDEIQDIADGQKVEIQGRRITNEEIEALQVEHNATLKQLADSSGKDIYSIVSTYAKKEEDLAKTSNKAIVDESAQTQYNAQLQSLDDSLAKSLISITDYNVKRQALENNFAIQRLSNSLADDNKQLDNLKKVNEDLLEQELYADQEFQDAYTTGDKSEIDAAQKKLDALKDAESKNAADIATIQKKAASDQVALTESTIKTLIEAKKGLNDDEKKLENDSLDLVKTIVDAGYEARVAAIQQEISDIQTRAAAEVTAEQNTTDSAQVQADKIANINQRAADQEAALTKEQNDQKRKEAEVERAVQVAKIIEQALATEFVLAAKQAEALAAAASWASVLNLPAAGIAAASAATIGAEEIAVGALAAVQVAAILATPLPAYKYGVKNAPGGLSKVGDGGKSELMELPSGRMFVTPPWDTYVDVPRGTNVYPDANEAISTNHKFAFRPVGWINPDRSGNTSNIKELKGEYRRQADRIVQAISDKQELHIAPGFNSMIMIHKYGNRQAKWIANKLHQRN